MKIKIKFRLLFTILVLMLTMANANAVTLWVGQSYEWDFSGSVMGSTYNMSVTSNGGYLSITGSGFYRRITPTQYFSGTATVTAEWDYTLYYGDTKRHQRVTLSVSCYNNQVSIIPTSITLSQGETYQLSYRHAYDNQYVSAANAYFSGGNSSFTVTSSGLITAKAPGSGYVNVYSKVSDASKAPACYVTVKEVEPTGASISSVSLLADQSKDLTVTVSPSNASIKSKQWYVKSGSDVVSISGQRITGLNPGSSTIYCMVNGSVRSNDATVTVSEPKFTNSTTLPANGSSDISVFISPSVTYSHSLSMGDNFNAISLTGNGSTVDGTVEISGSTVRFLPKKPLAPMTEYKLFIPKNAIKNKWGSPAQNDVTLSFKTAKLEQATVSFTPVSGSYLTNSDAVTITSNPSDAVIYYTIDGSNPTKSINIYKTPIKCNADMTVKALAVREGYEDSEISEALYMKSQSEIVSYYPNDANPLFNYAWATPYLQLSGEVEKSNNFRRISLTDGAGIAVAGEAYLTNYMIIFMPDEPLENCTTYTMDIPRDAVKTTNGEIFKGFNWSFTTTTLPSAIAMQGDESVFVLAENGVLKTRGRDFASVSASDGSFTTKSYQSLTDVLTGVDNIAGGFTHRLIRKNNGAEGYGMALCGEVGTAASISAIGGIKVVKAGFQTSAIIGVDNSLWMCGRNDFYQLGDGTGTTSKAFMKVADNVIDVALGNGYTLYITSNNELWAVGRNHRGQLGDGSCEDSREPIKVMEGVEKVYASVSGFFSACITVDKKLMTWGENSSGQLGRDAGKYSATPGQALEGVVSASLGEEHALAVTEDCSLLSWGSNKYGQISQTHGNVKTPALMLENVKMVAAGPNTSLVLFNSGLVTGWGKKSHSNFGSGDGNATAFTVCENNPYETLSGVRISPNRHEAKPESSFALAAIPIPYAADFEFVEWTSSNPSVAYVDGNGIIKTSEFGETNITVKLTDRFGNSKTAEATIICTDNPDNSGLQDVTADNNEWIAYANNNHIVVDKVNLGDLYTIYNIEGMVVAQKVADSPQLTFNVNRTGIFIVQSGIKAVKVISR